MRDGYSQLHTQNAFADLLMTQNTVGHMIDCQGFQSVALNLTWQQQKEGHSEECTLHITLEEGNAKENMHPVAASAIYGHAYDNNSLVCSQTKDLTVHNLTVSYQGSCRFIRLRAELLGKSETIVSGLFILGRPSLAPVMRHLQAH